MDSVLAAADLPGRLSRRILAGGVLALFLNASGTLVFAQNTPPAPTATVAPPIVAPAVTEEGLTAQEIENRRKTAADATDLSADVKLKADEAYRQALESLKRVGELNTLAAQHKRSTEDVAQRVDMLKKQLAEIQSRQPAAPSDGTVAELEQEMATRAVQLAELKLLQTRAEGEPTERVNRRKEIRALLLSAPQRLAEIQKQLDTPPPADEPAALTTARRTELRTRQLVIEAEAPALQAELVRLDAEDVSNLVLLNRDLKTQEAALGEKEQKLLEEVLTRKKSEASVAALLRARQEAIAAHPLLQPIAEENTDLAQESLRLTEPITTSQSKLASTRTRLEDLQRQSTATRKKVDNIGLSGAIGSLLRKLRSELPDLPRRRLNVKSFRTLIEDTQYQLFEYDDQRAALPRERDSLVKTVIAGAPAGQSEAQRAELEAAANDVLDRRTEYLDQLIRNSRSYLDVLFELDETEQLLIRETEDFQSYIDERVLWIRSNKPLFDTVEIDERDWWLLDLASWSAMGSLLVADAGNHVPLLLLIVAALGLLLVPRRRFRQELNDAGQNARRGSCAVLAPTWRATFLTLLLSLLLPGCWGLLGWWLLTAEGGTDFDHAVGRGVLLMAQVYFPLELLRQICRSGGLGENHFEWSDSAVLLLRRQIPWLISIGLPLLLVTSIIYSTDNEHRVDLAERISCVAATLVLAVFFKRVLRPDTGILCEYLASRRGSWSDRLKPIWYWGGVAVPLALAGLTISGFYYTSQQLAWRLYLSAVFLMGTLLLREYLQRLLLIQRRRFTMEQARERRAAMLAAQLQSQASGVDAGESSVVFSPGTIVPQESTQANVAAISQQSRSLINTGFVVTAFVGIWLIWVDVLPALRLLDQWPLWRTTVSEEALDTLADGSTRLVTREVIRSVTIAHLAFALLIVGVTVACARNLPGLMEMWILRRLPLDNSVRYAITSLTSYVIVLLGITLSFNAVSVGWEKVQWLATALTFGLAFGLQEIFANFVAGLILLFERPLRIGDVVTVDDVSGVVSRIRMRATTITNWDRKEYVVPNKEFITGRMLNWTLTDKVNRVVINIGIAYGSNVELAKSLMLKVCTEHPLTLDDPPSVVSFEGFGDNTLNFVIRTFLPDLDNRLATIDALHTAIDREFRAHGIEIAFPQRDLHLRSIDRSIIDDLRGASDKNPGQ